MIIAAAIKWEGEVYSVPNPGRHNHVFALMCKKFPDGRPFIDEEQGFLTDQGKFLDRISAAEYAIEKGQIRELKWPPLLYSEDLW